MATLADQRRAIAEGMRASRQATGEAERRATGEAMVRRRTGREEVEDLNAVIKQRRQRSALPALEARGGIPAQTGTGNYAAPPASTGGGIASPLTESGLAGREYYEGVTMFYSTDYLMAVELRPLKELHMTDANGDHVRLKFQRPAAGGG